MYKYPYAIFGCLKKAISGEKVEGSWDGGAVSNVFQRETIGGTAAWVNVTGDRPYLTNSTWIFTRYKVAQGSKTISKHKSFPIAVNFPLVAPVAVNVPLVARVGIKFHLVARVGVNFQLVVPIVVNFPLSAPVAVNFPLAARVGVNSPLVTSVAVNVPLVARIGIKFHLVARVGVKFHLVAPVATVFFIVLVFFWSPGWNQVSFGCAGRGHFFLGRASWG